MRANTSLIGHILGSHPQISGYYELHRPYHARQDLIKQQQLFADRGDIKPGSKYLFDKLLHNKYPLLLENLQRENIKVLLALRTAEQSIKSIVNLFLKKEQSHPYAEPVYAVRYYRERLEKLADFAQKYSSGFYYFDAELVRSEPQRLLPRLQQWLSLDSPLSEQYQIFSRTGQSRAGDSSANMQAGRIIKERTRYQNIDIPVSLLKPAEQDYQQCRQRILSNAMASATLD